MGTNVRQNIVTNGLVLYLDAGNRMSYPGSGTTWRDLSGNGITGSLNGTPLPTFNRDNQGSIVFDGTNNNNWAEFGTFNYNPGTTGELSLETWIYPTGPFTSTAASPPATNLGGILGQAYQQANSIGWGMYIFTVSSVNYFAFQARSGSVAVATTPVTSPTPSVAFTLNNWYHLVGTFTRNDLLRLYINTALSATNSSTALGNSNLNPSVNDARICRSGAEVSSFYTGARVASARLYNRALSAAEVTQNYNATKTRFGLT